MTEYTLAQVMEKMGRNPNLKFEYTGENYKVDSGVVIHADEDGYVSNEDGEPILSNFTLGSKFRLVNEPVDRMTAFRAFGEGKAICCDCEGTKYHYNPFSLYGSRLVDTEGCSVSIEEILHGKWFIEEGN